jgi:predicted permease
VNEIEFLAVVSAVVPVFGIALAGFILRRLNWLTEEADQSLLRISINLLVPALIFDSVLGNAALQRSDNLIWPPLVGMAIVVIGILFARWAAPWTGLSKPSEQRTFALATGLQNYGYVPIPLSVLLFDPGTTGVLFVHLVGIELMLWTLGVAVISGAGFKDGWRKVINAPLVAIVFTVLLNQTGGHAHVPVVFKTTAHLLGQCAIPLALLLIGAIIADHFGELHGRGAVRVFAVGALVRIGLLPLLILCLAKGLPISLELKRVIVLEAAMPSAVFPIIMAKHYGGDPPTALRVVLGTQLLGLITIPLWIRFGGHWVGLW